MTLGLPAIGIGIDIGGTSTKAAVLASDGTVIAAHNRPTERGSDGVIATAIDVAHAVCESAGLSLDDVDAIGIGIPGTVDPSDGTVRFAVNVGIDDVTVELGRRVAAELGRSVHVENDVRAAALGAEWLLASGGETFRDLAYLSVGTGIAAGHVLDGALQRGSSLVAGEIGHMPIDPAGPACVCGQTGCIEAIASGSAIDRLWPTTDGTSALALHRAMASGDPRAVQLWSSVIGGLSSAVLLLALTLDPEVIVLSGGVAALGTPLSGAIAERLAFDGRHSQFLGSLRLGQRLRIIGPDRTIGPIGAVRAAQAAALVDAP